METNTRLVTQEHRIQFFSPNFYPRNTDLKDNHKNDRQTSISWLVNTIEFEHCNMLSEVCQNKIIDNNRGNLYRGVQHY